FLAQAHVAGIGVDWAAVFAPWRPSRVKLPTYAFQRQRYWLSGKPGSGCDLGGSDCRWASVCECGGVFGGWAGVVV
ncbi:hypothetical protein, partial [Mycobacterium szulgai]|uniref:hypothetical protein n=1 Tax=Mycobacterium szulgai TaxID=1787 RepID=UPI0021F28AE9